MKKEIIYFDQKNYDGWLAREQEALETFETIVSLAKEVLATDKIDFVKLMENPREYVVNEYFDMYSTTIGPNIDKERWMQSQVNINLGRFDGLLGSYKEQVKKLKRYPPEITSKGFKGSLDKEPFNWYLDESKREQYEAAIAFRDATRAALKFGAHGVGHVLKFSSDLTGDGTGLGVEINYANFRA